MGISIPLNPDLLMKRAIQEIALYIEGIQEAKRRLRNLMALCRGNKVFTMVKDRS